MDRNYLKNLSRKKLQLLAKEFGIKANMKSTSIINSILRQKKKFNMNRRQKIRLISIKRSPKNDKKFRAIFKKGDREIKRDFGQRGASDYTKHGDIERRGRYIKRHMKDTKTGDPTRAGFLSLYILWNKKSLEASKRDYVRRLNIYNKTGKFPTQIKFNMNGSFLSQVMSGSELTTLPPQKIINIETFQQYIINNRLITVLGELHNKKSCLRPGRGDATPAQYIKYRIKQNPNHIKVLLEYFGDKSAREFSRQQGVGLSKCGNLVQIEETIPKKYIKKTDARKILGIYLGYLYTNEIDKINITNLNKIYLKPVGIVLKKFGKYLRAHERDYNRNELKYFASYITEKKHMYDYLLKNYDKMRRQKLVQSLQKIWIELADLDILKEILKKNNSIFEYIIIIGTAHSQHLYSIFSKTIKVNKKIRNGSISLKGNIEAVI